MHRYGIEDEGWFETARSGLERRGFKLRIMPRSIVVEKDGRLPRLLGSALELLEFAERQGVPADPASLMEAERYGDDRADLAGRLSASQFETPVRQLEMAGAPAGHREPMREAPILRAYAEPRKPEVSALEARMAELRLEQDKIAAERHAAQALAEERETLLQEKHALEERCTALYAELQRTRVAATEAANQRDLWQMSLNAAEERLRVLQIERDAAPVGKAPDKRFDQLRRFVARELHPDLAGEDAAERGLREALFKRIWAKIEQLQ